MSKLKMLRIKNGLTLKQVGKRVGRTESSIDHYETGRRKLPVEMAKKLASEYGCNWAELYEDDNDGQATVS